MYDGVTLRSRDAIDSNIPLVVNLDCLANFVMRSRICVGSVDGVALGGIAVFCCVTARCCICRAITVASCISMTYRDTEEEDHNKSDDPRPALWLTY